MCAIRCAYRPGVRLSQLEEQFGLSSGSIISVANRCTYTQYPTGDGEYEPPASIRGTRRREQAVGKYPKQEPSSIERTNTRHLLPEALTVIREAVDDGEPIRRIARCFGLAPEAIAHMKQSSRTNRNTTNQTLPPPAKHDVRSRTPNPPNPHARVDLVPEQPDNNRPDSAIHKEKVQPKQRRQGTDRSHGAKTV